MEMYCEKCDRIFRVPDDEQFEHECPRCGRGPWEDDDFELCDACGERIYPDDEIEELLLPADGELINFLFCEECRSLAGLDYMRLAS